MIKTLWLAICCFSMSSVLVGKDSYDITIKINGIKDDVGILAYYYGNKKYIKDTLHFNNQSETKITDDGTIATGLYLLAIPSMNNAYFEFIINEEKFKLETDTSNFIKNMKVKGSNENDLFYKDQKRLLDVSEQVTEWNEELDSLEEGSEEYKELVEKIKEKSNTITIQREGFIEKYPNAYYVRLLKVMKDIDIPEEIDSTKKYAYFKEHFFDNMSFKDTTLLRSPVLQGKLFEYLDKYTIQIPDSIIKSADFILSKSQAHPKMFQFALTQIFNKYVNSKLMGFESIYVHLGEKYYLSGLADWAGESFIEKLKKRVLSMKPTLLGKTAPDIIMTDTSDQPIRLSNVVRNHDYTIIAWWNSTCGHCKKEMPKLKEMYESNFSKEDKVAVFAVSTEHEKEDWIKFIREKELNSFYHAVDLTNKSPAQAWYDVYSTPLLLILDSKAKIIAKRIGIDNIPSFIEYKRSAKEK